MSKTTMTSLSDYGSSIFREPWQAKAFAMVVLLHRQGRFEWDEWVQVLGAEIAASPQRLGEDPDGAYHRQFLAALEQIVAVLGIANPGDQLMRRGIGIEREQGRARFLPSFEAALAEAEASAGEIDAGLRRLDDALAELEATEARCYEAEMHRIRGEILLKRDPADTAAAEQSLQTAIAIAQSQKARSFELRAALSLAPPAQGLSPQSP